MGKKEVRAGGSNKAIGLIGPDSTGKRLGRLTQAVYDDLKDSYHIEISYDGRFNKDSKLEIILYCGKYDAQAQEVIAYCKETGTTLVGVGDFWSSLYEGWNKFTFIEAHNMSLIIATTIMRTHEDGLRNRIISLSEYHQIGRRMPTSAAQRIAHGANYSGKIDSCEGIESVLDNFGKIIPAEYEDNFSIYEIVYKNINDNGEKELLIVDYGTRSKVEGARALCEHFTGPFRNLLDTGIYSFQYLVNAKFI